MVKAGDDVIRKSDDAKGENTAHTHVEKEADEAAKKAQKTSKSTIEPIASSPSNAANDGLPMAGSPFLFCACGIGPKIIPAAYRK